MDSKPLKIASVIAFLYRAGFSGLLFAAITDMKTESFRLTFLAIASIMITHAIYRLIKMLGFAKRIDTLKALNNNNVN